MLKEMGVESLLSYDIEVSYCVGAFWRDPWQTPIAKTFSEGQILTISWQWVGEDKVHVLGQCDGPKYKPGVLDDKWLVETFVKDVYNKADWRLGQNSDAFDDKWINSRLFIHGLNPPKPSKTFDTKKISKKNFAFISNKLDDMAKRKKLGSKLKHEGIDLWTDVMSVNDKAWKTMKAYNKHDVKLTTALWVDLIPWLTRPKVKIAGKRQCPKCHEVGTLQRRGDKFVRADGSEYEKYSCTACGAWKSITKDIIV